MAKVTVAGIIYARVAGLVRMGVVGKRRGNSVSLMFVKIIKERLSLYIIVT